MYTCHFYLANLICSKAAVSGYFISPCYTICYKLNGKVFAQIYPYPEDYKITLKCTADEGQFYRMVYLGKVVRGYHCPPVQQPYWDTIYLDDFLDEELLNMLDQAYETVFNSFSKKVQKQIKEEV